MESEGVGISNFKDTALSSEFSLTDSIFYFSNISAPASVVKTHPIHSRGEIAGISLFYGHVIFSLISL
jgi:hypothetical protein